jgi:hypothetical protein
MQGAKENNKTIKPNNIENFKIVVVDFIAI